MPRTPLQFQQMKDERKLSILESALPLFAIHGKDTTIDMICQKAKCSHGLAYHYFKNVDQIYNELLSSETYKTVLNRLNVFDENFDTYSQISSVSKTLVDFVKEPRFVVAFAQIIISDESKNSFYSRFVKLVTQGQKEGCVTGGNSTDIVGTFFNTLKGLYLTVLNQKHPEIKVPSIDNILRIILR